MSYHDNQLTSSAPNGRVKRASPQRLYILPIFCTHGAHHRMLLCIQSFKWFIDPLRKGKNLDILPKTEDFRLYVWYDFEYEFFNLFYTGGVRHSHIPSCQNIEVFNHCTTIIILQTVMFLMNSVLPSSMLPCLTFMSTRYLIRFMSTRVYTKTINTKTSHCTNSPQTCLPLRKGSVIHIHVLFQCRSLTRTSNFRLGKKVQRKENNIQQKMPQNFGQSQKTLLAWRKRRSIQCAFCIVLDSCNQCSLKHEILPVPPWTFSHIFPCEIRF